MSDLNEWLKQRRRIHDADPEPSEAEKLSADLDKWNGDVGECLDLGLAAWLVEKGWTKAPGGGDDE